jgi:tetratricopeptide (TPR) repeat protein/cold shock CspA family protein
MRNNPLHIKWFVSAVRAGKRPEEILADEKLFLRFCLSNVYEQLSEAARKVVRTLLSVGGANTTSEIAYLSELDESTTIRAIQELLTTNMFIASSVPIAATFQTKYELSQLSRSYLSRFYPVAKDEQERLMKAKRQLVSVGEQLVAESRRNPLSPYLVHCRDRSDAVPAKHLSDALREMRSGDFDAAFEALGRAKTLAPEFYEVARVEAWLFAHSGNISEAFEAYERAVELSPDAAHVRMFFGGFLLLSVQDTELALPQFEHAHRLLPEYPEPTTELARCHLYLKQYDEALRVIDSVGSEEILSERLRRKARDLKIQIFQRRAEDLTLDLAQIEALESLEKLRNYVDGIDFLDERMKRHLVSTGPILGMVRQGVRGNPELESRVESYASWLGGFAMCGHEGGSVQDDLGSEDAIFLRLAGGGKFGFARTEGGDEVFIHQTQFLDGPMTSLLQGDKLRLSVVKDELGRLRAKNVRRR